jgi:outer membrane protein assembly factor BamB
MRRIVSTVAALAIVACSSPDEKTRCATTADCGAGEFCARTSEGAVCWPDAVAPVVSDVVATCLAPAQNGACPRDGVIRVTATVTDDQEVGAVTASLSVAPETAFPLAKSGSGYAGELALADLPFATFEADVTVSVRAADGAGNEATAEAAAPVEVTRLRWTYDAGLPLSPAAVTDDGAIVVARAGSSNQALAVNADGTLEWEVSVGTQVVIAAPMVGAGAIWFASTNGTLYQVAEDGTKLAAECATGGALNAPAALAGSAMNFAVAGSEANSLYLASVQGACIQEPIGAVVRAAPIVATDGTLLALTGNALQAFEVGSSGGLNDTWTSPPIVGTGGAAPAIDAAGHAWTVSSLGAVKRTSATGSVAVITTVGADANGLVILPDGSAVLGDDSGKLKRLGATGFTPPWAETAALTGTPCAPLALAGSAPALVTGTSLGWLYAVRAADGEVAWSHQLGTSALRIGNVFQQAGDALPTAYFPAADGSLHAVVVDGALDAGAAWPKPYHDARNTGNAATPLP